MVSTASDPQNETPADLAPPSAEVEAAPPAPAAEEVPILPVAEEAPVPPVAEEAPVPPVAEEAPVPPVAEEATAAAAGEAPIPLVAGSPPVNAGVGLTLRAAREARGRTLTDCAKQLRIRQAYLEALEEGRHRDLPAGTYATGFLRTYADSLELDGEEMVRRFREEVGGFKTRTELSFPSPVSEGRIPGGAVIFLGLILAAVAYGGWYLLSSGESKVAEIVPPLPDRLAGMLNRPASLTGGARPAAEEPRPSEDSGKVREEVVPPQEVEEERPAVVLAPDPAPVAPRPPKVEPPKLEPVKVEPPKLEPVKAEPPKLEPVKAEPPKLEPVKVEPPKVETPVAAPSAADGKVWGTEYADSRVVLKAAGDDCWIQVREVDGSLLASRLLRRGDSMRVPNRPGLNLMVGNAGALEVSVDGRKMAPLGAAGQVRRDIRLDPEKLVTGG